MAGLRELDSYLRRIGLGPCRDWAAIHRAHATSIPFENLDPAAGIPVSLDLDALEEKLVARRRGGYCFEHNLLFKAALESVGIRDIDLMLARVRQGRATGPRPRSHLILRVVVDGFAWHADVGFGGECLLEPIPFGPGAEVCQSGWRYRTVAEGAEIVLQIWRGETWVDLYSFLPHPVEPIDVEVANWYTSTNPRSPFVSNIVVSAQTGSRRRSLLAARGGDGQLSERTPDQSTSRVVPRQEISAVLTTEFALPVPPALGL